MARPSPRRDASTSSKTGSGASQNGWFRRYAGAARLVASPPSNKTGGETATYVILRRGGWRAPDELHDALERSSTEGERLSVEWLRSYVLAEFDGTLGTVCIFDAPSPEAVRLHAYRAGLPVDEIVAVTDTVVVCDAAAVAESTRPWNTR